MPSMAIRDASLFVEVVGSGPPLVLMHGGPGLDHVSLTPFRSLADRHTVVFYDHRCNGRSTGVPLETMTWDSLTADPEALRIDPNARLLHKLDFNPGDGKLRTQLEEAEAPHLRQFLEAWRDAREHGRTAHG